MKVDNLRARGPRWIVLEKVRQKVVTIVWNDSDCIGLPDCECVHNDLVGMLVNATGNSAFQVLEIV
jgi:hypothetical protein